MVEYRCSAYGEGMKPADVCDSYLWEEGWVAEAIDGLRLFIILGWESVRNEAFAQTKNERICILWFLASTDYELESP